MRSLLLFVSGVAATATTLTNLQSRLSSRPLVSKCGQSESIPRWDVQSSTSVDRDMSKVSLADFDSSSWHHADISHCTLMGCLIEAGVYDVDELFFSQNLNKVNWGQFTVPWLYRNEFDLTPGGGEHYILQTNGINSKADLFFNGKQIATKEYQAGAYGGHTYDVSGLVGHQNALVVRAYPTDVNYDFAVGFVDWNPSSPCNDTGVWRDITIKQTGPVSLGPLSVHSEIETPVEGKSAVVTLQATAQNMEDRKVHVQLEGSIAEEDSYPLSSSTKSITLGPHESRVMQIKLDLQTPKIWWPKHWGDQPMYGAKLSVSSGSELSDVVQSPFGVRNATYHVNGYQDGMFSVNGHHFQVLGGGYASDIFLRWDSERFSTMAQYVLDMGMNSIRLEGKMDQPELYEIADRMGLMILPGWECCDKWESWSYNDELSVSPVPVWDENDYETANASMLHEAAVLQPHPSILGYLIGSDYWPDNRATELYLAALEGVNWQAGIVASAGKLGYPNQTGPGGMKMNGPYDWVPPNYWYDTKPASKRYGAAFGFGSELGAGVGTPEIGSLKKFLNASDLEDLWTKPKKALFHMSTNVSSFYNREIYDKAMSNRYGAPTSLDDYLLKAQMMDYEATRAEFEGFSALWNAERPATGAIYWMLNDAWPGLHWNQFDYYLHPGGSYFGTKVGSRKEHVAFDYLNKNVWLINHSLDSNGPRTVEIELMNLEGKSLSQQKIKTSTKANTAANIGDVAGMDKLKEVAFLRLVLYGADGESLSRNVYWITNSVDVLNWDKSSWFSTPVTDYVDYTALSSLKAAKIVATSSAHQKTESAAKRHTVTLENRSDVPAFFIRLNLADSHGEDVVPVTWSDNYVTLWPHENLSLDVDDGAGDGAVVQVSGWNVGKSNVKLL